MITEVSANNRHVIKLVQSVNLPSSQLLWQHAQSIEVFFCVYRDVWKKLVNHIVKAVSPGRDPVKLFESKEVQKFWDYLGGKTAYASGKKLEEPVPSHPSRLFQASNAIGRFIVEKIFDYSQEVSKNSHTTTHSFLCCVF